MGVVSRTRSHSSSREVAIKLTAKGEVHVAQLAPLAHEYEAAADALAQARDTFRKKSDAIY